MGVFGLLVVMYIRIRFSVVGFFFFQAEDGIRDLVRSRGLGDVYKRQVRASYLRCNGCTDAITPYSPNLSKSAG